MSQLFKVAENILSHIHLKFSLILCFIKSHDYRGSAILVADRRHTPHASPIQQSIHHTAIFPHP